MVREIRSLKLSSEGTTSGVSDEQNSSPLRTRHCSYVRSLARSRLNVEEVVMFSITMSVSETGSPMAASVLGYVLSCCSKAVRKEVIFALETVGERTPRAQSKGHERSHNRVLMNKRLGESGGDACSDKTVNAFPIIQSGG